ncbi:hypothetical protein EZ449_06865 [Pedobacter frigidisoli]|uniref:Uncharacterized protein n=1 Tax=Pedobacter frigidisoli TaxID=2530455 RepID=A0A4R0P5T8_9SPHI|nr:hypothetical protein [Pedobacter frigidisoli]TCD11206.1 hypothetical protein EZ449_06865 [Pedobacter frigidisoli]
MFVRNSHLVSINRTEKLTVQATLPNLKRFLDRDIQRNVADRVLYMGAIAYKFISKNESALYSIEPRVTYRGVENYKNILDAGANLQFFGDKLLMSAMHHSTNSVPLVPELPIKIS